MQQERGPLAALFALLSVASLFVAGCRAPPTTPAESATELAVAVSPPLPPAAAPTRAALPTGTSAPASPSATATFAATATPVSLTSGITAEVTGAATPTLTSAPMGAPTTRTAAPRQTPIPTAGPTILAFRITPDVTTNVGDVLTMSWQATGERSEICPVGAQGPIEQHCRAVSLSGSTTWVTDEASMSYAGFALRAWVGPTHTLRVAEVRLQCRNLRPWFFANPPQNCPAGDAATSNAAGQYFEHGFMIWTEEPDTFYVFYQGQDAAGFQTFDWVMDPNSQLRPGASPDNRVGESPPAGLFEPMSGFGMVWRGEVEGIRPDARQRLGWATEPEFAFESAHQCMTLSLMHYWVCFQRGPRGEILRLHPDSTAQARFVWEEW